MTSADWLIIAVMLTAVTAALVFDRVIARRQHTDDTDRAAHHRLMGEIRRQP